MIIIISIKAESIKTHDDASRIKLCNPLIIPPFNLNDYVSSWTLKSQPAQCHRDVSSVVTVVKRSTYTNARLGT